MPALARPSYARELWATFFFAIAMAIVEGGVIGVFVKQTFEGTTHPAKLNFIVALLVSAPELANIVSFIWVSASRGRDKIKFINALQLVVILLVGCVALVPTSDAGLIALAVLTIAARICWSGIITLRPTVWRSNYPRSDRARMIGKFSTIQVLVVAATAFLVGAMMDANRESFRVFVPIACVIGLAAVVIYGQVRIRQGPAQLREELQQSSQSTHRAPALLMGPSEVLRVLRKDRFFAKFQLWMFVLGFGNLMMNPILVVALKDRFGMEYKESMLIVITLPLLLMPLAIPLWASLLDRAHVVRFRSLHSWSFVVGIALMLAGMALNFVPLLYAAAMVQGIAYGGGTLAWNLGHHDFAPPNQTSQYMAAHVTLNGVRGLLGPQIAMWMYTSLNAARLDAPVIVISLSLLVSIAGALGFVHLRRTMGSLAELRSKRAA